MTGRIPLLDALRGLAAFLVLLSHVGFWTGATATGVGGAMLARGDSGVAVFFALSAFLLLRPAVTGSRLPLSGYARRRAARILPAYWVALVAVILAASTLGPLRGEAGSGGATRVLMHVLVLQGLTGDTYEAFTQTWSLTTELTFYLVVPVLLAGANWMQAPSGRGVVGGVLGCIVAGLLVQGVAVTTGLDALARSAVGHLAWFTAGVAVLAWRSGRWVEADHRVARMLRVLGDRPTEALLVAALVAGVALTAAAGPRDLTEPTLAQAITKELLYTALAFLLLLAATAPAGPGSVPARLATSPATRWLGNISYGVFLWHVLVLQLTYRTLRLELFSGWFPLVLVVVGGLTVVLASLSWWLLERPVLAWAHRGGGSRHR